MSVTDYNDPGEFIPVRGRATEGNELVIDDRGRTFERLLGPNGFTEVQVAGSVGGLQTVVWPALAMAPDVAPNDPTPVAVKYGDVMLLGHSFHNAPAAVQYSHFSVPMPRSWDPAANMDIQYHWFNQAGSGGVVWASECFAVSNGESLGGFFSNDRMVTDTVSAAYDLHSSDFSAGFFHSGASIGDMLFVRVRRATAEAPDTLAQPAILMAVSLRYSNSVESDE